MTLSGTGPSIDFGTSTTVAFLRRDDGTVTPLLFDASPLLASGVFAAADGTVLTGADAVRAAAGHPASCEPNPNCGSTTPRCGWARELPVHEAIAAVLRRVADEARRVAGAAPDGIVLGYPAAWSYTRLAVLAAAADAAGLAGAGYVREPVAAAAYFATVLRRELKPRQCLVVYDFGAGTFDVSVVRRTSGDALGNKDGGFVGGVGGDTDGGFIGDTVGGVGVGGGMGGGAVGGMGFRRSRAHPRAEGPWARG